MAGAQSFRSNNKILNDSIFFNLVRCGITPLRDTTEFKYKGIVLKYN